MPRTSTNPLEVVLSKGLPPNMVKKPGFINQPAIAKHMGMTRQGVNLWLQNQSITIEIIDRLLEVEGNELDPRELAPFCPQLKTVLAWFD